MHSDDATIINNKEQPKKDTPSALSARIQKMGVNFAFFGAGFAISYLSNPQKNTSKAGIYDKDNVKYEQWIRNLEDDLYSRKAKIDELYQTIRIHRTLYDEIESDLESERKAKENALNRVKELQKELDESRQISAKNQRRSF